MKKSSYTEEQIAFARVGFVELRFKVRRTAALLGRAALNAPELVVALEKTMRSGQTPIGLNCRDLQLLGSGPIDVSVAI